MDVYKQCCSQVAQLLIAQESESEPFKNKYSAAEQLCQCKAMVEGDTGTEITPTEKSLICAILDCRRGLTLLETDLLSDAETALESGLASLKHLSSDSDADYTALILEGSNGLAALWCNRDEFDKAKGFLDTANEMYSACQGCTDSCAVPDHLGGDDAATFAAKVEEQHTLTLFYLAQVYGHLGDKDKSAEFCGATLIRQLRTGGCLVRPWSSAVWFPRQAGRGVGASSFGVQAVAISLIVKKPMLRSLQADSTRTSGCRTAHSWQAITWEKTTWCAHTTCLPQLGRCWRKRKPRAEK